MILNYHDKAFFNASRFRTITKYSVFALVFLLNAQHNAVGQVAPPNALPDSAASNDAKESLGLPAGEIPLPRQATADPRIQARIRAAINGDSLPESGDPILQGMLDVLKSRGSILDGSTLDQELGIPAVKSPEKANRRTKQQSSKAARVAEMLLKTARLMESLGPMDKNREQLIEKMRQESRRLLPSAPDQVKMMSHRKSPLHGPISRD